MSHSWAWSALLRDLFVSNSLCHGGESRRAALTGSLSCRGNLSHDAALLSGDCWPWWGEKNGGKQARERERDKAEQGAFWIRLCMASAGGIKGRITYYFETMTGCLVNHQI